MSKDSKEKKASRLPFKLMAEVCSVIQDTGYVGSAEEYVQTFYGKPFVDLTICEAEMIIRNLKDKEGCLFNTKEGGYDQSAKKKEAPGEAAHAPEAQAVDLEKDGFCSY